MPPDVRPEDREAGALPADAHARRCQGRRPACARDRSPCVHAGWPLARPPARAHRPDPPRARGREGAARRAHPLPLLYGRRRRDRVAALTAERARLRAVLVDQQHRAGLLGRRAACFHQGRVGHRSATTHSLGQFCQDLPHRLVPPTRAMMSIKPSTPASVILTQPQGRGQFKEPVRVRFPRVPPAMPRWHSTRQSNR